MARFLPSCLIGIAISVTAPVHATAGDQRSDCQFERLDLYKEYYTRLEPIFARMQACGLGHVEVSLILQNWGAVQTRDHVSGKGDRFTSFDFAYDIGRLRTLGKLKPCRSFFLDCFIKDRITTGARTFNIHFNREDRIKNFNIGLKSR